MLPIDVVMKVLDEVKIEAEELKAKIIEQGYAEVEAERKRVQEELRVKVASLAIAGAEKNCWAYCG